jgi:alpha-mannosidase
MTDRKPWHVLRFNHFDPLWRRCWDRDIHADGRRFVSYRSIEERWISDAIASTADGKSCFLIECSWVLRHYLERHPEQREVLRQLTREGRFELLGSGENIVDANLIHGELLARNLALGTWWSEAELGTRPTTGWHSDGFGSSAQMPQIFRQCGYDWLPAISYNTPDAPYWRGLDGTAIFFACGRSGGERLVHRLGVAHCYRKLPPCPACGGAGCSSCAQQGFVAGPRAELTDLPAGPPPGAAGVIMLWGEEILPGLTVAADIASFNAGHPGIRLRQGIYRDLRPHIADLLARVDDPPAAQISSKVENNPCHTGCYVSRIAIKQLHRASEHALLAAEAWDGLLGGGASRLLLRSAWQRMTLSGFHDSITSSHCDQAYDELCDLHRVLAQDVAGVLSTACTAALTADRTAVTVFNHTHRVVSAPVQLALPTGCSWIKVSLDGAAVPVYPAQGQAVAFLATAIPALGARTFRLEPASIAVDRLSSREIRCGAMTVTAGEHGIAAIAVDGLGQVADTCRFQIGELVLEHDLGDPWATRSLDRTRERLAPHTRLSSIERHGDGVVITYVGKHPSNDDLHRCADPAVTELSWNQRFHLRDGVPWIEVETEVVWFTHGRRLRLAFPSSTTTDRGVYDVPYGTLERGRYEGSTNHGGNAGGDWPAIHWAGVQAPSHTFAVFNHGTPSCRVEDGVVMLSILRSPQLPYCLADPSYTLYNYHGMADHGTHRFRHAIHVAPGDWRDNGCGDQAALFNGGLSILPGALRSALPGWVLDMAHTRLTAVKAAEDGHGIILRLVESSGLAEVVRVTPPPAYRQAEVCSLLEDPGKPLVAENGRFAIEMRPWQILSVRLTG